MSMTNNNEWPPGGVWQAGGLAQDEGQVKQDGRLFDGRLAQEGMPSQLGRRSLAGVQSQDDGMLPPTGRHSRDGRRVASRTPGGAAAFLPLALLVSIVYGYLLVKIILFKFGTPNPSFLLSQLGRLAEDPAGWIGRGLRWGNLVPGETIRQNLEHISSSTDRLNLFGNIALFVPMGILFPLVLRGWRQLRGHNGGLQRAGAWSGLLLIAIIGFAVSLALETSQLVFSIGTFDVDDLILNTGGAILGYLPILLLKLVAGKRL
ncbi:VanZ family protein [Cohnella fermenti]|uniref:VanZ family protein n=1 Tax=Cohnella fermenti TaxID=2565925 RepID=A0A4S4BJ22_9BACL|nr:VanZ family protein [Cohnella fermenti]THF74044.1 VanZ family protein [Cohnella fermenti]